MLCDFCLDCIYGKRYACSACPDYVLCTECYPVAGSFRNQDIMKDNQAHTFNMKRIYVVQRRVNQLLYDVSLSASGDKVRNPLIGTYHSVAGEYLGLGVWRSSADRICAISHGGAWMCSVMRRDLQ